MTHLLNLWDDIILHKSPIGKLFCFFITLCKRVKIIVFTQRNSWKKRQDKSIPPLPPHFFFFWYECVCVCTYVCVSVCVNTQKTQDISGCRCSPSSWFEAETLLSASMSVRLVCEFSGFSCLCLPGPLRSTGISEAHVTNLAFTCILGILSQNLTFAW